MKRRTGSYVGQYYLDSVGRRRKISHGAMLSICESFAAGVSVRDLAQEHRVSVSLIRTITYNTPRNSDLERLKLAREMESKA